MKNKPQAPQHDRAGAPYPELKLKVTAESVSFFTTVLQYGVEIETIANIPLGKFLCTCPGFSEDYLLETVQTIFLDGTPRDDLQTPLSGQHPVVALSAAMPGLAGAIFRKNSRHSGLRTLPAATVSGNSAKGPLTVTLKLFNRIAREKGALLLSSGVVMASGSLSVFLTNRPELHHHIKKATFDTEPVSPEDLPRRVRDHDFVTLWISACDG